MGIEHSYIAAISYIHNTGTMKRRKKTVKLIIILLVLSMLPLYALYPPDYAFLYSYFTGKWKDKESILQAYSQNASIAFRDVKEYHLAAALAEYDIVEAQKILLALIKRELGRSLKKKVLYLLGELYFVSTEYTRAEQYFWNLLILEPDNPRYRSNYELAVKFAEIHSAMNKISEGGRFSEGLNSKQEGSGLQESFPENLLPIQKSDSYFLYMNDEKTNSTLPQW